MGVLSGAQHILCTGPDAGGDAENIVQIFPSEHNPLDMEYAPKAGVFSAYLSNDSRHLGKKITKARALKYLQSLEGHITCRSATKFLQEVQTLHLIIVLCPDGELTPDNWMSMLRCDCKGYWGTRCCSHNTATAAWYGNEWGLTPHDETLIDVIHLAGVIQPNAKPGRPKKRRKALDHQPQSPPKKIPEAQKLLPQEFTPVHEEGPDVEFTHNVKRREARKFGEALEKAATEPSGADNKKGKTSGAAPKPDKPPDQKKPATTPASKPSANNTTGAAPKPDKPPDQKKPEPTPASKPSANNTTGAEPKPDKPPDQKKPEPTPASKPSANNTTGAEPKPDKPPDQKKPEPTPASKPSANNTTGAAPKPDKPPDQKKPEAKDASKLSLKRRRRDVVADVAVKANKASQPKNKDYINKHVLQETLEKTLMDHHLHISQLLGVEEIDEWQAPRAYSARNYRRVLTLCSLERDSKRGKRDLQRSLQELRLLVHPDKFPTYYSKMCAQLFVFFNNAFEYLMQHIAHEQVVQ
jgi:hypothetical protein